MIDLEDLNNLHACIEAVIFDEVPSDLIETGVWRGGACIFMRAALNVYGDQTRTVWVADSFEGFPKTRRRYVQDEGDDLKWTFNEQTRKYAVAIDEVKVTFSRYGLLDERVRFLKV
jgi:hypothetical protein